MHAWDDTTLAADHAAAGRLYHEFLRVPAMSGGLYVLPAGGADPQAPHGEDEVARRTHKNMAFALMSMAAFLVAPRPDPVGAVLAVALDREDRFDAVRLAQQEVVLAMVGGHVDKAGAAFGGDEIAG